MIRINLLPGPKRRAGAGAGLSVEALKDLVGKVKDPLLLGVAGAWAVGLVVVGFLFVTERAALNDLRERDEQVRADARRFQNMIRQKRRAEDLRDSLVAELQAIRAIDADRYVWPHILEEITKALPDFTWLQNVAYVPVTQAALADTTAAPPVQFVIEGRTSNISAFTRFVRQLNSSPWIGDVTINGNEQTIEEDRQITAFNITVTFRTADSAFIRTVPVLESVQ